MRRYRRPLRKSYAIAFRIRPFSLGGRTFIKCAAVSRASRSARILVAVGVIIVRLPGYVFSLGRAGASLRLGRIGAVISVIEALRSAAAGISARAGNRTRFRRGIIAIALAVIVSDFRRIAAEAAGYNRSLGSGTGITARAGSRY